MRGPIPASLKAHPLSGCAKEPFRWRASPHRDGVLALAFHTLLSFQGTSPGCSSATHLRFPRPVAAGAAGRYHGPFKIVKDFPPARRAYSWWSTARHVDTFTQKRRPAPRASGRQDGHRTAVGSDPVAFGDLLSSDADAAGVVPERSLVLKNFPAYSPKKVASRWTACQLHASAWGRATTTVPAVATPSTASAGAVFRGQVRTLGPAVGPETAGRR
jgi:hypothetical protein